MKRFTAIIILLCGVAAFLFPGISEEEEQFIYSIHAFDGKEYRKTFCNKESETIYLLSDTESFLMPRKTFVYFDAALNMWRIDSQGVNQAFDGVLEITGPDGKPVRLDQNMYTYYSTSGEWDMEWKVYTGQTAREEWDKFQELKKQLRDREKIWDREFFDYRRWREEMVEKIRKTRLKGQNVEGLVEELNAKSPPPYPGHLNYDLYPIEKAFIVNLPKGEYRIRLLDARNRVYEGSEKRIVTFSRERTNSVGFVFSALDKFQMPRQSRIPQSVMYINGSYDLYLMPFLQHEFNDFYHEKLSNNDGRGNPLSTKWIATEPLHNVWLEISRGTNREMEIVLEEAFITERSRDHAFGYKIAYYDRNVAHNGRSPDLSAFYVPMDGKTTAFRLRLKDFNDRYYDSGEREIRIVWNIKSLVFLLVLAGIPIAAFAAVFIRRIILYRSAQK